MKKYEQNFGKSYEYLNRLHDLESNPQIKRELHFCFYNMYLIKDWFDRIFSQSSDRFLSDLLDEHVIRSTFMAIRSLAEFMRDIKWEKIDFLVYPKIKLFFLLTNIEVHKKTLLEWWNWKWINGDLVSFSRFDVEFMKGLELEKWVYSFEALLKILKSEKEKIKMKYWHRPDIVQDLEENFENNMIKIYYSDFEKLDEEFLVMFQKYFK